MKLFFFDDARLTLSRSSEEPKSTLVLGKSTCNSRSSPNPTDPTECAKEK